MRNKVEDKLSSAIKFYYLTNVLKDTIRQGAVQWKVAKEHKESDADHTFGCLMLAIGLNSELKPKIDFEKTFMMIAIHELEEIFIGDCTIFERAIKQQKMTEGGGKIAVEQLCSILTNKNKLLDLINEFNEGKTAEARFAKAVDKLENVLEFKKYVDAGLTSLDNATPQMKERIIEYYNGEYDLSDAWYTYHFNSFKDLGFTKEYWHNHLKPMLTDNEDVKRQLLKNEK